jgi:membrane-bound serine protease (ClpP class)
MAASRRTTAGRLIHNPSRLSHLLPISLVVLLAVLGAALVAGAARTALAKGPQIDVVTFARDVGPASQRFLNGAIDTAQQDGAALLVIQLDTPGGDLDSMKAITQAELASRVPIAVYVSPQGGRAASAGTFIALSAPIVAMAPNTRIGAASPVDAAGNNLPSTLDAKVKNDLLAQVRSVQATYHRNVSMAEQTVSQAAAFTDQEALQGGMIDLRAGSLDDLLSQLDGRSVTLQNGTTLTLQLAGLPRNEIQETFINQVEAVLLDPNVLFILFIAAAICIYLEIAHPGAIVPGTVGGIALLLFLYGAGALNPNWVGLGLMLLAIVLFGVDLYVPSHGVPTAGALISLALGAFIFFDTNAAPGQQTLDPRVLVGVVIGGGLVVLLILQYVIRSRLKPVTTGKEGLIGKQATVLVPLAPDGRVRLQGEDWAARLEKPSTGTAVEVGQAVRVRRVEGLRLIVEPVRP